MDLTKIWIGFTDKVYIVNSSNTVELKRTNYPRYDEVFMYGTGKVTTNSGCRVYSNSKVDTNKNIGRVYGNGDIFINDENGFVFGNGFVGNKYDNITNLNNEDATEVWGYVYGNGGVGYNCSANIYSNADININVSDIYGNGTVIQNTSFNGSYGNVYGNGNVENNNEDSWVFGNGDVINNDGSIIIGTYYKDKEITDLTFNLCGNGNIITVNGNGYYRVINGEIYLANITNVIKGNIVSTSNDTQFYYEPNAIVNSSVIRTDNITAEGNRIEGNNNVINGFRVYNSNVIIGSTRTDTELNGYNDPVANVVIGDYNVINPNWVDSNVKSTVTQYPNIVIGNNNVINDTNTIVLRGTCNIFNDPKN